MKTFMFVGIFYILLVWGAWGFFNKLATNSIGPWHTLFWASTAGAIAYICTAIFLYMWQARAGTPIRWGSTAWWPIIGVAFGITGGFVNIYLMSKMKVSVLTAATAVFPAVTLTLALLFLGEKLTPSNWAGLGLAVVAVLLLTR